MTLHSLFSLMGFSVEELELLRVHNPNVGDIAPKYRKDTQYIYGIKVSPVRGGGGATEKKAEKH